MGNDRNIQSAWADEVEVKPIVQAARAQPEPLGAGCCRTKYMAWVRGERAEKFGGLQSRGAHQRQMYRRFVRGVAVCVWGNLMQAKQQRR